jgi:hypothetical protein
LQQVAGLQELTLLVRQVVELAFFVPSKKRKFCASNASIPACVFNTAKVGSLGFFHSTHPGTAFTRLAFEQDVASASPDKPANTMKKAFMMNMM